jgi:hypothetical protein
MTPSYHIELEAFESVVPGGVRRVTWLVQQDEDWLIASEFPGARVEQRDARPGTVWVRSVTLELPPGSLLVRIESEPSRTPPRDPLAYLFGSAGKKTRQSRRGYFVVKAGGKLERVPPPRA